MVNVKLVVVTSNDLVRSGIQMLLHSTSSIELKQSLNSIQACHHYLQQHHVHVLLLDDALPGVLSLNKTLYDLHSAFASLRILILSDCLSKYYVERLIQQGASGFIYKHDHLQDTLVAGIKTVADGHIFLSPQASALPYGRTDNNDLNHTDMEVLQLIARGYTVQEISNRMGIVNRSVYRIRGKLRHYLDVRTNEQLVEAAHRRGLLSS